MGKKYLSTKYPNFDHLFSISHLGVPEQKTQAKSSDDEIFRIVTCSNLVPIKRIELLIRGLEELGNVRKDLVLEWTHIGDGPLRLHLEHIAATRLPQNVKSRFLGFLPNDEVISFYLNNYVDAFINISSSEGAPVSIMEAQSCAIPVIATSVGGNPELVTNDNGILLSENPEPDEIANAICILLRNPDLIIEKKRKSFENWKENFNSKENFQLFFQDLIRIMENCDKTQYEVF